MTSDPVAQGGDGAAPDWRPSDLVRRASPAGSAPPARRSAAEGGEPVDVDLHQFDLPGQFGGELFQCRADHPAGAAPRRPQVDHNRNRGTFSDLGEVVVVRVGDPRAASDGSCRTAGCPSPPPAPGSSVPQCGHVITFVEHADSSGVAHAGARLCVTTSSPSTHSTTIDRTVLDVASEQRPPDPGLHLAGDEPAQRPGTVDRVEALLRR